MVSLDGLLAKLQLEGLSTMIWLGYIAPSYDRYDYTYGLLANF